MTHEEQDGALRDEIISAEDSLLFL